MVFFSVMMSKNALAPQFTTKLEAIEVMAFQSITLECSVIGFPEPEITWYQVRFCLVILGSIIFRFIMNK